MLILSHYLQGFRGMGDFPGETGDEVMEKNVHQEGQTYVFILCFYYFQKMTFFKKKKVKKM